jgi:bifunctional N-acetylglucosamine-1-phosphate-uridyltransferase/glucosamine-1-phosphate-acetyltransferase GlmU-like protein
MYRSFDIILPCAGSGVRMNSDIPKPLRKINGTINIENTILKLKKFTSSIYMAINYEDYNKNIFKKTINKNIFNKINFIKSISGSGDGQAILDILNFNQTNFDTHSIICWGDVFIDDIQLFENIIKHIFINKMDFDCAIPLYFTNDPYVNFVLSDNKKIKNIRFKRRKQISKIGYSDYGIFFIKNSSIKYHLMEYKQLLIKQKMPELNFLDFILFAQNNYQIKIEPVIMKKYNIYSYNTNKELKKLNEN